MAVADCLRRAEALPILIACYEAEMPRSRPRPVGHTIAKVQRLMLAAALLACVAADAAPGVRVDLLIRNGTVVDGTGAAARVADVAIRNNRIVEVAPGMTVAAREVIDAAGLVVAPGFIDGHNHSKSALVSDSAHLNELFLRQGVTTVVLGPDGEYSPSAIRELLAKMRAHGAGTNVAFYVGHNGIRTQVLGSDQNRAPSAEELVRMESLVREGMELGAVGLSSGLMYSPGLFSETDELIALAKQVAPFSGVYESHVRDPHDGLLQSDWEAIEIGRQARIPVNLTHLTTPGKNNRGLMRAVIDLVESARREGIEVVADQYPYPAVGTIQLWGAFNYPPDLGLESREAIRAALRDPAKRTRIREETLSGGSSGYSNYKAVGPSSILILSCLDMPQYENKFVSDIAAERGMDGFEAIAFLLESSRADIVVSLGGFYEEDMRLLMQRPWTMIASDGFLGEPPGTGLNFFSGHPRTAGTFPRVLGKYVREEEILTIEEAVRKATSAPAEFLDLPNRGKIRSGYIADIVIFDPEKIADRSTWREPHTPAAGVVSVLVNGEFVIREGILVGAAPGHFVRRAGSSLPLRAGAAGESKTTRLQPLIRLADAASSHRKHHDCNDSTPCHH